MDTPTVSRHGAEADAAPVLVWRFASPRRAISSSPVGGGIGLRAWIVNAQVPRSYERTDIDVHLHDIAREQGCSGEGIGMLTAARVDEWRQGDDAGVRAYATVGVSAPTWAADIDGAISPARAGTINVVVFVPAHLDDSALVNAVITATEAKSQALFEHGVPGTGTASDAVCVLCDAGGPADRFAGPRSRVGASLARAVHRAVGAGVARP
jgi:adenosylcobinamide hydrolase